MPQILVLSSLFDHDSKIKSSFVRMHNPTFWEACPIEICQPARPLLPFPYSKSQGLEFSPPRGDHKAQGLLFEGERTVPASLHLGCGHNDVEVEVHSTCVKSADFFVKTLWIHGNLLIFHFWKFPWNLDCRIFILHGPLKNPDRRRQSSASPNHREALGAPEFSGNLHHWCLHMPGMKLWNSTADSGHLVIADEASMAYGFLASAMMLQHPVTVSLCTWSQISSNFFCAISVWFMGHIWMECFNKQRSKKNDTTRQISYESLCFTVSLSIDYPPNQ